MKLSKHADLLEVNGGRGPYYPVILHDNNNLILVDAGFPMDLEPLTAALINCGFEAKDINKIILTHQDIDHIGCVNELLALSPEIEVMAHKAEAPYIDGRLEPIKLANMDKNHPFYKEFKAGFDNRRIKIQKELEDTDLLPFCGGIEIIHTPGHAPGHICLYLQEDKVLIVGDALNVSDGKLTGPNPIHTYDMDAANKSVKKLMSYDVKLVATYHGGKYDGAVSV